MFACLLVTGGPLPRASADVPLDATALDAALLDVAQQFSPRVAWIDPHVLVADLQGLERLFGDARAIGERARRSLADRGLQGARRHCRHGTAARLLAAARAGLTLVEAGGEQAALAALPIDLLQSVISPGPQRPPDGAADSSRRVLSHVARERHLRARRRRDRPIRRRLATFRRWGLRTLGDLASLPRPDLAARLGARRPGPASAGAGRRLPAAGAARARRAIRSHAGTRMAHRGTRAAVVRPRPAGRSGVHTSRSPRPRRRQAASSTCGWSRARSGSRSHELPTPIKDPRTLRTLALLDLESHPPSGAHRRGHAARGPHAGPHAAALAARAGAPGAGTALHAGRSTLGAHGRITRRRGRAGRHPPPGRLSHDALHGRHAGLRRRRRSRRCRQAVTCRRCGLAPAATSGDRHRADRRRTSGARARRAGRGCRVAKSATYAGPWRTSGEWWTGAVWDRDEWDWRSMTARSAGCIRDRRTIAGISTASTTDAFDDSRAGRARLRPCSMLTRVLDRRSLCLAAALTLLALTRVAARDDEPRGLDLYFIDVEGGAATLIVTPAGESILIDSGNPGDRDAGPHRGGRQGCRRDLDRSLHHHALAQRSRRRHRRRCRSCCRSRNATATPFPIRSPTTSTKRSSTSWKAMPGEPHFLQAGDQLKFTRRKGAADLRMRVAGGQRPRRRRKAWCGAVHRLSRRHESQAGRHQRQRAQRRDGLQLRRVRPVRRR